MGELIFVGLGLSDELGLSLRGLEELKACDRVFAEFYTSLMPGLNLQNLTRTIARRVEVLSRAEVEEHPDENILSAARSGKVALLVAGDPMVATTHVDLRLRAQRLGIRTRIIHGASVGSAAAGITGLQSYKFGRTVTIPASTADVVPESVYSALRVNLEVGLHSLILLEVDVEGERGATIPQAVQRLLASSRRSKDGLIRAETLLVGLARVEAPDMILRAGTAAELANCDFGGPPHYLILPGKLHFVEVEALVELCGARKDLVNPRVD